MAYEGPVPIPIVGGGTNATSMANTDGVVYYDGSKLNTTTVGTAGQVLTSNGAAVAPTFQAAGGGSGALVLLSTKTAANTAILQFTSVITNTYNRFLLIFDKVQPAVAGGQFYFQVSTDNGVSYLSTNYASAVNQWSQTTGLWAPLQGAGGFLLTNTVGTGHEDVFGTVYLQNFTSGAGFVSVQGQSFSNSGTLTGTNQIVGSYEGGTISVNAIRLFNTAGNMTTGVFSIYGITQ